MPVAANAPLLSEALALVTAARLPTGKRSILHRARRPCLLRRNERTAARLSAMEGAPSMPSLISKVCRSGRAGATQDEDLEKLDHRDIGICCAPQMQECPKEGAPFA